jgi:hypothetical protein
MGYCYCLALAIRLTCFLSLFLATTDSAVLLVGRCLRGRTGFTVVYPVV